MDWRHWASIARLSIRKMSRSNTCKKLRNAQKILRLHAVCYSFNLHLDPNDFLHEVQFSAAIEVAYFPAETTRPLGPRLSAIFTILHKILISPLKKNPSEPPIICGLFNNTPSLPWQLHTSLRQITQQPRVVFAVGYRIIMTCTSN